MRAWEVVESVQFGTDDRLLDAIAEAQTEPTESWIAMTLMLSCAMADAAEARGWDEQTYRTAMLGWFAGRYLASELLED